MSARTRERERPKRVLTGLQEMIADVISELDLQAVLNKAVQRTAELVKADIVTIHIYDSATGRIRAAAGYGLLDEEAFQQHVPGRGKAIVLVVSRGEPVIADDIAGTELAGPFSAREHVASAAGFPVQVGEEVIGALFVSYRNPHAFEPEEIETLVSYGNLAAVALNNARLFEENARLLQQERELRKQAETLRQVSGTIGSAAELDQVKNRILDGLARIVEYDTASLQIVRGDYRTLLAGRNFDVETASRYLLRPVSRDPLIQRIVQSQEPLILSHPEQDADWGRRSDTVEVRSWIGVPLIYSHEVIGLLTADHHQPGFYKEDIRDALVAFADEVAIAVRNARIFDSAQRRIRDLEIINDVAELMATKLDTEALLKTIVSQIAMRLDCTHCTIFFPVDRDGETYLVPQETYGKRSVLIRTRRFRSGEGLAGWVFQHGESLVLGNAKEDERFAAAREEQDRPRSMLVVPVKVGDRTIGVISADQDEYGWFGESERWLVEALARQAGIAIERASGLTLLQDIGHRILSAPEVEEILYQVVQGALRLTHTTSGVIYLISEDSLSVARSYQYPDDFDHPLPRMDRGEGITRQVIRDGQVRTFRDIVADRQANPVLHDRGIRSMIAVPMKLAEQVIGVLYLNDVHTHQFTDTEISLLSTLASQASIAIENVRLFEASRQQARELTLLHQVSARLMTLDLDALLAFIVQGAMHLTATESGYIYLLSDDGTRILKSVAYPPDAPYPQSPPSDRGLTRYIFEHGEPVFITDTSQDGRVNPAILELQIKSFVGQPLKIADRVIGILYLNDTSLRGFSESERSLISTVAEQAAVAIYNAHLFADSERLSKGYQTLNSVGTVLMGMLNEQDILKFVASSAAKTLDCTHCTVFRVQADQLVVETSQGDRGWSLQEGRQFRLGQGLAGWVAEAGKSLLVPNAKKDDRFDPGWSAPQPDPESLVIAPLVVGSQIYGVISAEHNRTHAFDKRDQQLLETLASQASQAIQNARLFETRRRLESQLESLHQVVQEQNLDVVLERIVEGIRAILGEGISPTINLYNEETDRFSKCHACGPLREALQAPPRAAGTGRYVIKTGRPLYLPDVHDPPTGAPKVRSEAIASGIQSFAAIPLRRQEHIVGVLFVNAQQPLSFSPEIRRVLELFAGQAAIAIHISQDLERKIRELEVLTEMSQGAVSDLGVDQILDLVYEQAGKIVDLSDAQVQIAFYDQGKDEVSFPLAVEQDDGETIDVVRWGEREVEYREILFSTSPNDGDDLAQSVLPQSLRHKLEARGIFLSDSKVMAVEEGELWLASDEEEQQYTVRKGELLDIHASGGEFLFSVGLEHLGDLDAAVLSEGLRKAFEQHGILLSDDAVVTMEEEGMLWSIADRWLVLFWQSSETLDALPYREVFVKQFQPRARREPPGLNEHVIRTREPLLITGDPKKDFMQKAADLHIKVWATFGRRDRPTHSWLGVPMTIRGQVTGVISIQSLEREHAFDQDHLRLLSTVASQAAVAIENAKLYEDRTQAWQEARDEAMAAERERIEAEKWAYLGRVAGSLAHRIGNKGGMIRLCVQDLEELLASLDLRGSTLVEATEYLDTIRRNNRYLLSLSNFLFKPRKAMEETRGRADVHNYLEEALKYAEIPAGVQVERHFARNLRPVLGNKYLVEVFLELIVNAVEAVEATSAKKLSITTAPAGKQWIEIRFKDTGSGIAPEDRDFVFELFAQASDKRLSEEGHQGYGLWWVRMFLKEIGGDVSVESELGKGSTFIVRLPVAEDRSER